MGIHPTLESLDWLADHGHDPSFGARPLKGLIEAEIGDRLAMAVLEGRVADGDSMAIGIGDDGLLVDGEAGA